MTRAEADPSAILKIAFDEDLFAHDLARDIARPGVRPVDAVKRLLSQHLTHGVKTALGGSFVKRPLFKLSLSPNHASNRWATLPELEEDGFVAWYPTLSFATKDEVRWQGVELGSSALSLVPIDYGHGITRACQVKVKPLKTQINVVVTLTKLKVERAVFRSTRHILDAGPALEQPYLANPEPRLTENGSRIAVDGDEFVSFDHVVEGHRVFCRCAKAYHRLRRDHAESVRQAYAAGAWPERVLRLLDDADYRDDMCHLCVARALGLEAAAARYGDEMRPFLGPYTKQCLQSVDGDARTARSNVQQILGLVTWVREAEMYRIVKDIFANRLVLREASPPWLGRQRLDVYVPTLKLALEHQGEQHHRPVSRFGGAEAFARTIQQDALKKRLCAQNGVELVYVHFGDALTMSSLKHRLRHHLPA